MHKRQHRIKSAEAVRHYLFEIQSSWDGTWLEACFCLGNVCLIIICSTHSLSRVCVCVCVCVCMCKQACICMDVWMHIVVHCFCIWVDFELHVLLNCWLFYCNLYWTFYVNDEVEGKFLYKETKKFALKQNCNLDWKGSENTRLKLITGLVTGKINCWKSFALVLTSDVKTVLIRESIIQSNIMCTGS